jgi:ABC-2 type transport system ATP-binding protein
MSPPTAVEVSGVTYRYRDRLALDNVSLAIREGEMFAFLGPNGGGKTTLLRLLTTLIPLQQGTIRQFGLDISRQPSLARTRFGVVFQAPSLDKKLTVRENIRHQARLYGVTGRLLQEREQEALSRLGLEDRLRDRVETLSGGLRRRVELAKGLIHHPRLLFMDEPSGGLDPGARSGLWDYVGWLRREQAVTVVWTTHLLEEAERADRIALLDHGQIVAEGPPDQLKAAVGGDAITIECEEPVRLAAEIQSRYQVTATTLERGVRLELPQGHEWIARLVESFPGQIRAIRLSKPTLEDVFIHQTGHALEDDGNRV